MPTPGLVYKIKDIIRVPTIYSKRIRNVVARCRVGMIFSVGVDIFIQKQISHYKSMVGGTVN